MGLSEHFLVLTLRLPTARASSRRALREVLTDAQFVSVVRDGAI